MLQWVIVYLCSHTVQIKLSASEPKQKGINVGKGWVGVPRRESNKEGGEVRKMHYTQV